MTDEQEPAEYPDWQPRAGLDVVQLANALEHIRRGAYLHWIGGAFDPEHMNRISMIAAQALCGQPIDAPVDMTSPEFKAGVEADFDRLTELFDDGLEHAATAVAAHDHDFQPDPDRTDTLCCTQPRCRVLLQLGTNHHPYRELTSPDRMLVAVDEQLVDLIERLWSNGVETFGSCQGGCCETAEGNVGQAWIVYGADGANEVLSALAGAPGIAWDPPRDGRYRVRWDATGRCRNWDEELTRRKVGAELVGARIEWAGR